METLEPGDIVDVIAPAAKCSQADVIAVKKILTSWNLIPRISIDIFGDDLLCANSDEKRFSQLSDALLNTESKAIWCLKGGYGCARLIANLEKLSKPKHQKWFIGFSDITVLHLFLQQKWGWQTWHGPGVRQVALAEIELHHIQEIKNIIFGEQKNIEFTLKPMNAAAKQIGDIDAMVTGGTLSLLQTSIGTSWQVNANNKILFIEDCNERGYKLDRMLQHLKQAKIFSKVKAVLLGDFIGGEEPNGVSLVSPVLQRFAEESTFPVLYCSEVGHGKSNRILPFGMPVNLSMGEMGKLTIKNF